MTRVLVDADALVYSAGFATQKTLPDGSVMAQPVEFAIHFLKLMLQGISTACMEEGIDFSYLELFLTGKGNYRETLATIKGYKANRKDTARPVYYQALRDYLQRYQGATVVDGYEADDRLAMLAHDNDYDPERLVICSIDKDLMTVPGKIYNGRRKTWYLIDPMMAQVYFYRQILTGDTIDNVGGCYKYGPKAAERIIVEGMTELEMYEETLDAYRASLSTPGCPYVHLSAEAALLENAQLLWLQRWEGQLWLPPMDRTP